MTATVDFKFNFKSRKITDESGKEIGRTKKQDSVIATLAVPTVDEITLWLSQEDSPVAKLIRDNINRIIYSEARDQFDEIIESFADDDSKVITAGHLDHSKLTLEYIASLPPSTRGGSALTEDDFNLFFDDYLAVMMRVTGKEERRIVGHLNLFKRPQKARANKEALALLVEHLDIYMSSSANIEDTGECASRIRNKFAKWLAEPEKAITRDEL